MYYNRRIHNYFKTLALRQPSLPALITDHGCITYAELDAAAERAARVTTVKTFNGCPAPDARGLTLELYTVISYPVARFIRLTATRLGEPARDDPGSFRLQLSRLRVVRPEELRTAKP